MILNLGVHRTGTVYVQRTLKPVRPHGHYFADSTMRGWAGNALKELPPEYRSDYKIGFVRNPFDLLVSWWELMRRPDVMVQHPGRRLGRLPFGEYLRTVAARDESWPQKFPLHAQLFDQQWNVAVDYLGRYETLDADLKRIAEITGATYTPLEPINSSNRRPWQEYYTEELYELVEETWFMDLSFFGYDRDGVTDALTTFGQNPAPTGDRSRHVRDVEFD